MSTDDRQSETGRLPTPTAIWEQLKPLCLLAGFLLVVTLLFTLELVVRL